MIRVIYTWPTSCPHSSCLEPLSDCRTLNDLHWKSSGESLGSSLAVFKGLFYMPTPGEVLENGCPHHAVPSRILPAGPRGLKGFGFADLEAVFLRNLISIVVMVLVLNH